MHDSQLISQIPENSVGSRMDPRSGQSSLMIHSMQGSPSMYSTRRIDMERNMRSNIQINGRQKNPIVFVRVSDTLRGPIMIEFQQNLLTQYADYLYFEYFQSSDTISRLNLSAEPVSCIIVGWEDRMWAKKFTQNQIRHNLNVFLLCHQRTPDEYPMIMRDFSNQRLKPVATLQDTQDLIKVEYELYSNQYVNEMAEKRIRNKFYYKANTNEILNIYYEEQLGKLVSPYVHPISGNKKYKKTNFFRFKDLKQLVMLAKGRKNMKKSHTKKIEQTVIEQVTMRSIKESRVDVGPVSTLGSESVRDLVRVADSQDVNYILVTGGHPQLEDIKKFCMADRSSRMLILDSQKSLRQLKEQMQIFANDTDCEMVNRQRIVMSERLLLMLHYEDEFTRMEAQKQQNFNFHTEIVLFVTPEQLNAQIWRVHENENYFGLLILNEDKLAQYVDTIEGAIDFGTPRQIENFKVLVKNGSNDQDNSLDFGYVTDLDQRKTYLTTPFQLAQCDNDTQLLRSIFEARNFFYHPAQGIIGTKVYVYIRRNRTELIESVSQKIRGNRRLVLETYEDRQQLEYFVQKCNKTDCALVVTNERQLLEVMKVIKNLENVYILLISAKERLSYEPQILKTGLEEDVCTFLQQIPDNEQQQLQQSYIESDEADRQGLMELRRIQTEPELKKFVLLSGRALLTVRLPNNQQSKNSILFENRIRRHFQEEVNFRTYENTEEIRDMEELQQPLQYLIINDSYLEWTKRMATVESDHKFDIIYFTRQPLQNFRQLVDKQRFIRFKYVSNSWRLIEEYIIRMAGRLSNHREIFNLSSDRLMSVGIASGNRKVQEILKQHAIYNDHQIAKRTVVSEFPVDKEKDLILWARTIPENQLAFVVVDEKTGKKKQFEVGNMLYRFGSRIRQILISQFKERRPQHDMTVAVVNNEQQAVEFLLGVKFIKKDEEDKTPMVFVEDSNLSWRYALKSDSNRYGRYLFATYKNLDDLTAKMSAFRREMPETPIWLMVDNADHLSVFRSRLAFVGNIGFILKDSKQMEALQVGDTIFSHYSDRQILQYLSNFDRRCCWMVADQALPRADQRDILLCMSRQIPIREQEQERWKRIKATCVSFGDVRELQGVLSSTSPTSHILMVLTNNQDIEMAPILRQLPNIKRIVVDLQTRPRSTFYEHPNLLYLAHNMKELHDYLANVRYTIRTPPQKLSNIFRQPITHVFLQQAQISGNDFNQLERNNEGIKIRYYGSSEELRAGLTNLPEGTGALVLATGNMQEKLGPVDYRYKIALTDKWEEKNMTSNRVIATDEAAECLMMIRNMPNNRFVEAKKINKACRILVPRQVNDITYKDIEEIAKRNQSLGVLQYSSPKDLEKWMNSANPKQKTLIWFDRKAKDCQDLETAARRVQMMNSTLDIGHLVEAEDMPRTGYNKFILFHAQNDKLMEIFFENIPQNEKIQKMTVNQLPMLSPSLTPQNTQSSGISSILQQDSLSHSSRGASNTSKSVQFRETTPPNKGETVIKLSPSPKSGKRVPTNKSLKSERLGTPVLPAEDNLMPLVNKEMTSKQVVSKKPADQIVASKSPSISKMSQPTQQQGKQPVSKLPSIKSFGTICDFATSFTVSKPSKLQQLKPMPKPLMPDSNFKRSLQPSMIDRISALPPENIRYLARDSTREHSLSHKPQTDDMQSYKSKPQQSTLVETPMPKPQLLQRNLSPASAYSSVPTINIIQSDRLPSSASPRTSNVRIIQPQRISALSPRIQNHQPNCITTVVHEPIVMPMPPSTISSRMHPVVNLTQNDTSNVRILPATDLQTAPRLSMPNSVQIATSNLPISRNISTNAVNATNDYLLATQSNHSIRSQATATNNPNFNSMNYNSLDTNSTNRKLNSINNMSASSLYHVSPLVMSMPIGNNIPAAKASVAIIYPTNNVDLERLVAYICNNSPNINAYRYPLDTIDKASSLIPSVSTKHDRMLVLTDDQKHNHLQRLNNRCRVYRHPNKDLLTEISLVFNFGWERKLLNLPFSNPLVPDDLILSDKINILIPEGVCGPHMVIRNPRAETIPYKAVQDVMAVVEESPNNHYNLVACHENMLGNMWQVPFNYPNTRLLLLLNGDISLRDWFDYYGDIFWLYADKDRGRVQKEIEKLLDRDIPSLRDLQWQKAAKEKPLRTLFHRPQFKQAVQAIEYLPWKKKQYEDEDRLLELFKTLKLDEQAYTVEPDGRDIRIQAVEHKVYMPIDKISKMDYNHCQKIPYGSAAELDGKLERCHRNTVVHDGDEAAKRIMNKYPWCNYISTGNRVQSTKETSTTELKDITPVESKTTIYKMIEESSEKNKNLLLYLCDWLPLGPDDILTHVNLQEFLHCYEDNPGKPILLFCDRKMIKELPEYVPKDPRVRLILVTEDQSDGPWLSVDDLQQLRKKLMTVERGDQASKALQDAQMQSDAAKTYDLIITHKQMLEAKERNKIIDSLPIEIGTIRYVKLEKLARQVDEYINGPTIVAVPEQNIHSYLLYDPDAKTNNVGDRTKIVRSPQQMRVWLEKCQSDNLMRNIGVGNDKPYQTKNVGIDVQSIKTVSENKRSSVARQSDRSSNGKSNPSHLNQSNISVPHQVRIEHNIMNNQVSNELNKSTPIKQTHHRQTSEKMQSMASSPPYLNERPINQEELMNGEEDYDIVVVNNMLYRTNKKPKQKVEKRSSERPTRYSEEKRYRRKYAPSTFGTAIRFQYFDEKFIPSASQTTNDRQSSAEGRRLKRPIKRENK